MRSFYAIMCSHMRMQYDIFVCIRGCAVKEMWLHIYIYRRIIHILEYESIECVPKMGEFLHKKITSHSYDAFKRIDDLARQNSRCWHSNGSPFSFSLFHFLSFSHFESCRGKKNFFQKCVLSFILMACIRIRFIHINKFYQPTKNIYVYNNTYIVFFLGSISLFSFSSVRYFLRQVPKWSLLSLSSRLHFVWSCSHTRTHTTHFTATNDV